MAFIDISIPIQSKLVVWPGDPQINITWLSQIKNGSDANVSGLEISAHSGTHVDAPFHFIQDGTTIDKIDLNVLIGPVIVVEVPVHLSSINSKYLETLDLTGFERILFKTRNSVLWERHDAKFNISYVAIEPDGAGWLVDHKFKLVGIDYLSIAPFNCTVEPHKILLEGKVVVVEGLNLSKVTFGKYILICLPLNLQGREAAPARAILQTFD